MKRNTPCTVLFTVGLLDSSARSLRGRLVERTGQQNSFRTSSATFHCARFSARNCTLVRNATQGLLRSCMYSQHVRKQMRARNDFSSWPAADSAVDVVRIYKGKAVGVRKPDSFVCHIKLEASSLANASLSSSTFTGIRMIRHNVNRALGRRTGRQGSKRSGGQCNARTSQLESIDTSLESSSHESCGRYATAA